MRWSIDPLVVPYAKPSLMQKQVRYLTLQFYHSAESILQERNNSKCKALLTAIITQPSTTPVALQLTASDHFFYAEGILDLLAYFLDGPWTCDGKWRLLLYSFLDCNWRAEGINGLHLPWEIMMQIFVKLQGMWRVRLDTYNSWDNKIFKGSPRLASSLFIIPSPVVFLNNTCWLSILAHNMTGEVVLEDCTVLVHLFISQRIAHDPKISANQPGGAIRVNDPITSLH